MSSPTQRTLAKLRDDGWSVVEVVEYWQHHSKRRKDLFGIWDILAVGPEGTLAAQTTSGSNMAARVTKITKEHAAVVEACRAAGWTMQVHGWAKCLPQDESGKRRRINPKTKKPVAKKWECRVVEI